MSEMRIQFHDSDAPFRPAKRPSDEDWIDTSFSQSARAIGHLRLPGPANGRYESKHPILDVHGARVGFMVGGRDSLGYTFACIHAGDCFWVAHQVFHLTMSGSNASHVSLVARRGTFMFSTSVKFGVVKSFGFGGRGFETWVNSIRAFKLLDDGACLLYLTDCGVCLFDTHMREIVAKAEFAYQWFGFALSPKVKLLAIAGSTRGDKDPLDGEYRYRNSIRIYDLETGVVIGEKALPGDRETRWTTDFSKDGHQLGVASNSSTHAFKLVASP